MKQEDYHGTITVKASLQEGFDAIAAVNHWWARDFEGSGKKQGDRFTVRFGETFVRFEVLESLPKQKLVWLVVDCYLHWLEDKTEWTGTELVWELSDKGGQVQISLTHIGLGPQLPCYETCVKGWDQFFKGSLYQLLTEKKGQPN